MPWVLYNALHETWFRREIPDPMVEIEGFTHIRTDRTEVSGKSRDNDNCGVGSKPFWIQSAMRTLNCCVSAWGHSTCQFGNIQICSVYIPPMELAPELLSEWRTEYKNSCNATQMPSSLYRQNVNIWRAGDDHTPCHNRPHSIFHRYYNPPKNNKGVSQ